MCQPVQTTQLYVQWYLLVQTIVVPFQLPFTQSIDDVPAVCSYPSSHEYVTTSPSLYGPADGMNEALSTLAGDGHWPGADTEKNSTNDSVLNPMQQKILSKSFRDKSTRSC